MGTSSRSGAGDLPKVTVWALRYSACILQVLAIAMTAFRATYRWRRRNLSWDDGWAIVAAGFNCVLLAFLWVRSAEVDGLAAGHPVSAEKMKITYLWGSLAFTCTVWAARVSIACSILRFIPQGRPRVMLLYSLYMFVIIWGTLLIAKTCICTLGASSDDCYLGKPYMFSKLVTDVLADGLLVAIPLYLLWHTRLPKTLRRIIRVVFATTSISAIISIIHICFQFQNNSFLEGVTALLEGAITTMVCNLLVIVTFFYRMFRNGVDMDESMSNTTFNSRFASGDPSHISLTELTTTCPSHVLPLSGRFTSLLSNSSRLEKIETMQFQSVSSLNSGEASKGSRGARAPDLGPPV